MIKKISGVRAKVFILFLLAFLMSQCANQSAELTKLPTDIRGIRLEMTKEDAHKRLNEIAGAKQDAAKGQEVWKLKADPNFDNIMLGYDKEGRVKYITTTVDKDSAKNKKRVRFAEIGDLAQAKKESVGHINKYMWDVEASNNMPEHQVYTYGEDEEYLLHFSLARRMEKEEESEE
jgi:hypothetical protein